MVKAATLFVILFTPLFSFAVTCRYDLNPPSFDVEAFNDWVDEFVAINDALIAQGFAPMEKPKVTGNPHSWHVTEVALKVVDSTKSPAAKYVSDMQRQLPRVQFIASHKSPRKTEAYVEWELGNGTTFRNLVYFHFHALLDPATLLTVLKHEGVHVRDYELCLKEKSFEHCAPMIAFVLEDGGAPFPGLVDGYNRGFAVDEWEAFTFELSIGIRPTKITFLNLQQSLINSAIGALENYRRTKLSQWVPAVETKFEEIPVAEFKFTWEGRVVTAVVPYFDSFQNKSARIEMLVRTFRARQMQLPKN